MWLSQEMGTAHTGHELGDWCRVKAVLLGTACMVLRDILSYVKRSMMERRIMKVTLLDNQTATNELLKLLTYLPLAIVQAVAFINSNQVSISDYLSLFKRVDTEAEILSERFEDPNRYQETENTIARTWQISFNQILKQDRFAARYLSFMVCIDSINIPQSLLPVEGTAVQRLKALGTLAGYAFIAERQQISEQLEGERFFNVHRLVQKATVWWLKEHDDWTAWTETAYGRLEELVPYGGHEGRSIWKRYLPHAIHIADLCSTLSETRKASLLDRIGRCQATLGQYATAGETHRRVLSLRRKNIGNEEASTLTSMNQVARPLNYQGKYEEAEAMHRQTLALNEKVLGKEHPDTLMCVYCLAHLLARQDLYDDATTLYQRACDSYSVVLRDNHPTALACQRHYLEMLQRKEQSTPIVSSEVSELLCSS